MLISTLPDLDGSRCVLTYDERNRWLRATWRGFIDPEEAQRGAENYLAQAEAYPCAYLLNDNLALTGPWFDSVEWLKRVWLPHAQQLGLRYIAHVVQRDTHTDMLTRTFATPLTCRLELQFFNDLTAAQQWLRSCQR